MSTPATVSMHAPMVRGGTVSPEGGKRDGCIEHMSHVAERRDVSNGRRSLCGRVLKNFETIGIKAHAPKSDTSHELFRAMELAVAAKDAVDKLAASALAHGLALGFLGSLEHALLTDFEELAEALPQPLATVEKILDRLEIGGASDLGPAGFGSLDFVGELDEQEPQVACDFGHGRCRAVIGYCPVVDPFAE